MAKIKVQLVRGLAGKSHKDVSNVHSLGLRKPRQVKEHEDTPIIRGMIQRVSHLVSVVKD